MEKSEMARQNVANQSKPVVTNQDGNDDSIFIFMLFIISRCDQFANCTDVTGGSFHCQCRVGFEGDGFTCTGRKINVFILAPSQQ
jgi:hypothetical protein